jgi:hypothetical protein
MIGRRGFFQKALHSLAVLAGLAALPQPVLPSEPAKFIKWQPKCENPRCGFSMKPILIDLDAPMSVPNQCPRCLWVIYTGDLGEQILRMQGHL